MGHGGVTWDKSDFYFEGYISENILNTFMHSFVKVSLEPCLSVPLLPFWVAHTERVKKHIWKARIFCPMLTEKKSEKLWLGRYVPIKVELWKKYHQCLKSDDDGMQFDGFVGPKMSEITKVFEITLQKKI